MAILSGMAAVELKATAPAPFPAAASVVPAAVAQTRDIFEQRAAKLGCVEACTTVAHRVDDWGKSHVRRDYPYAPKAKRLVGTSFFARVKVATERKTGARVVVKVITLNNVDEWKSAANEIFAYRRLDSKEASLHILPLRRAVAGISKAGDCKLYLVFDRALKDLDAHLTDVKQRREMFAWQLAHQLVPALEYCHNRGIVHCDVKPQNILVIPLDDGNRYRLSDFGSAAEYKGEPLDMEPFVTFGYAAPECLRGMPYGPPCDVFGLAGVLFTVLTQQKPRVPPFAQQASMNYQRPQPDWSQDLTAFMGRCLADAGERATWAELRELSWYKNAPKG